MNTHFMTRVVLGATLAALIAAAAPSGAFAQTKDKGNDTTAEDAYADDSLSADFKGTIGLGLIGAELGLVIPAVAGARGVWPYIVFPVVGAGGGAVAGYFLLEKNDHAELAVASLVAGMALAIPALVATLAATAYEPDVESPTARAAAAGPGLVRLSPDGTFIAPPAIGVRTTDAREALRTGAPRARTVSVALLSGRFF
jgi:hypothetical protein